MANEHAGLGGPDERFHEVLLEYVEAAENGSAPPQEEFLARHPEFAAELAEFFTSQDQFDGLAAPLRWFAQAVLEAVPGSGDTPFSQAYAGGSVSPGSPTKTRSFGDYELLHEIGQGGMGVVYKAHQKSLHRLVALKMIRASSLARATDLQRFRAEAEAAASLDHPHIVPIYEVGEWDEQPYFGMKLVTGGNLMDAVAKGKLSRETKEVCRVAAQVVATVARAVHHAHQRGILHRDLKPSNILLDRDGQPHVTDFGLSRRLAGTETQPGDASLTQTGQIIGTPGYMAPEQASGKKGAVTTATDVYGLGAVLYALLAGRPPFRSETVLDTLAQVKEREPERPSGINRQVDRDLETICLKCLDKEPQRRYGSAEALAEDLERWLAGEPIQARPPGRVERLWRWGRRNPLVACLSMLVLLVTLGGFLGVMWQWQVAARERDEASFQRDQARQKAEEIRQHLYVANMAQAFRAWQVRDHEGMHAFLDRQRPGSEETDLRGFEWGLLHRFCRITPRAERSLRGHVGEVYCVAFAPDGTCLASAGKDGKVHFWDPASGEMRPKSLEHADEVNWVAYSPSGMFLATACDLGMVKVWNVATAQVLASFKAHGDDEVRCVAFSPDGTVLATGANDNTVKLWSVGSYQLLKALPRESSGDFAAFAPDGSSLCTVNSAGLITLWDPKSYSSRQVFRTGGKAVLNVQYSHDSRVIAAAGKDGIIRRWETRTGQRLPDLVHGSAVQSVAFSPDDAVLASSGDDAIIRIWDLAANAEQLTLRGHRERVWCVAYSPDGKRLASSSHDQLVKLWQPGRFIEKHRLSVSVRLPGDVAFSSDGQILATCNLHRDIEFWNPYTGEPTGGVPKSFGRVEYFASSPVEPLLALFREDGTLQLWNLKTNQPDRCLEGPAFSVTGPAFSPDGTRLAAALDKGIAVWNVATGRRESFFATSSPSCRPAFAPDSRLLAGVCEQGMVGLWKLSTGTRVATLRFQPVDSISSVAFSPDGALLAVGLGPTVKLWDVAEGVVRNTLVCHEGMAGVLLAFAPNGRTLAAGGRNFAAGGGKDGTVILWSVATGQEILALDTEACPMHALTFSPDGSALVAAEGWEKDQPRPSRLLIWRADTIDAAEPRED
jgi:WD40 repeat protein/tRNA A-37 threonylcarbamoyl transferase component Bud32